MVTGDRQTGRIEDAPPEQQGLLSGENKQTTPAAGPRVSKKTQEKMPVRKGPTGKPKTKTGAMCRIYLLDGKDVELEVDKSALGEALLEAVYKHLSLAEKDYFSLTYYDGKGAKFWLNPSKRIDKQLKGVEWAFAFETKFYPTDPNVLHEDLTRLPCSFITHALLGSYAVQSDLGDHDVEEHGDGFDYIKDMHFMPGQTEELLAKVAELHRIQSGQSPADAEGNYMDNAKNLALYGVHMHQAKDREGDVNVGVCAHGLVIYRDGLRINRFTWPKIIKISYKKNTFIVRIRREDHEVKDGVIVYTLPSYEVAKKLWKLAVEHHAFFRLKEAEIAERTKFAPFGSKFRYSGRTQHQSANADYGRKKGPTVDRSESHRRFTRKDKESPYNTIERGGAATDRKEDKIIVVEQQFATLTLPDRKKKPPGAYSTNVSVENGQRGTGNDDDGNLALLAGGGNADYSVQYTKTQYNSTNSQPGYDQYGTNRGGTGGAYDPYGTNRSGGGMGGAYDPYGTNRSQGRGDGSYNNGTDDGSGAFGPDGRPLRGSRGNLTNGAGGGSKGNLAVGLSAEDQLYEHSMDGGAPGGRWGHNVTNMTTKTVITKTVVQSGTDFDDFDHDKALREAILAVTDMNTDLSVEKIEIQTKTETK